MRKRAAIIATGGNDLPYFLDRKAENDKILKRIKNGEIVPLLDIEFNIDNRDWIKTSTNKGEGWFIFREKINNQDKYYCKIVESNIYKKMTDQNGEFNIDFQGMKTLSRLQTNAGHHFDSFEIISKDESNKKYEWFLPNIENVEIPLIRKKGKDGLLKVKSRSY